jgi:hypothetical protein
MRHFLRRFWGWSWVCLGLLLVTRVAAAKEEKGYLPVHVCVHPDNVPKFVLLWTYFASDKKSVYILTKDYATKRYPYPTFLYDPKAPPTNAKYFPREQDRNLPCEPPPPPKEDAKPEQETPPNASPAPAREAQKGGKTKEQPPARTAPVVRPKTPEEEEQERRERTWRSKHLVLPHRRILPPHEDVLPHRKVLPPHEDVLPHRGVLPRNVKLLPVHHQGDICGWILPPADPTEAKSCAGGGDGDGKGSAEELRTWLGKATTDMAVLAAVVNMQFDEDLERKDGRKYGIVGGKNLDGPDSALVQAFASITLIAAVVVSAETEAFEKKLKDALAKGRRLLMRDMEKVGEGVAEEFAKKEVEKVEQKILQETGKPLKAEARLVAEKEARTRLSEDVAKNGAIGPYKVMKQFTEKLKGELQAHHILEKRWAKKFPFGDPDKFPSVILTEAEHKAMTAKLAKETVDVKGVKDLWAAYQKAYTDHPTWLAAIQKYFIGK